MNAIKINTVIKNDNFLLTDLEKFVGKTVEISITEYIENKKITKKWQCSGLADLKGALDVQNIRDLAYD